MYVTKSAAIGVNYAGDDSTGRTVLRSSINPNSYSAKRWYRTTHTEDPWIGFRDHMTSPQNTDAGDHMMYGEDLYSGPGAQWTTPVIASDGGMCVWVRSSTTPTYVSDGGPGGIPGSMVFMRSSLPGNFQVSHMSLNDVQVGCCH